MAMQGAAASRALARAILPAVKKEVQNVLIPLAVGAGRSAYRGVKRQFKSAFSDRKKQPYSSSKKSKSKFSGDRHNGPFAGQLGRHLTHGSYSVSKKPALIHRREYKGFIDDSFGCFVGFGVNFERLFSDYCRVLAHCLCTKAGFHISNYMDPLINRVGAIDIIYYTTSSSTETAKITASLGNDGNLNDLASSLKVAFASFNSTNGFHKIKHFLFYNTKSGTNVVAQISASAIEISMSVFSEVLIQNQTVPEDGSTSTDHITSNPLRFQINDFKSNIAIQRDRNGEDITTWAPWCTYNDQFPSLYVRGNLNQFGVGNNKVTGLSKMFVNGHVSTTGVIQPGAMRRLTMTNNFSGNVTRWFKLLTKVIADDVSNGPIHIPSKHRIIAFDKMLDQDSAKVAVAYELHETIKASWKHKKVHYTVPLFNQ